MRESRTLGSVRGAIRKDGTYHNCADRRPGGVGAPSRTAMGPRLHPQYESSANAVDTLVLGEVVTR